MYCFRLSSLLSGRPRLLGLIRCTNLVDQLLSSILSTWRTLSVLLITDFYFSTNANVRYPCILHVSSLSVYYRNHWPRPYIVMLPIIDLNIYLFVFLPLRSRVIMLFSLYNLLGSFPLSVYLWKHLINSLYVLHYLFYLISLFVYQRNIHIIHCYDIYYLQFTNQEAVRYHLVSARKRARFCNTDATRTHTIVVCLRHGISSYDVSSDARSRQTFVRGHPFAALQSHKNDSA